ncbi:protein tamozhennic [Anopheles ziemanni]|uniref:protein tamozhennic n=1 Tax=Anopheles coustani TaxID=139045 RepID=UPI00265A8F4A|nr:protein tamozhennic [Anopheles coustani]XP_058171745.1 protein tamozhennic [Anopheles ziemanni]
MAYTTNKIHDELWEQILENHWKYLESEESMQKIQLRRDLEELIENRLGKVSPKEKFFLNDTKYVFDSSVACLDGFTAYKASIGFEAVSQYANNLFVKPWRKEYKVIKMYSGFYQHEIASNLLNAEKLFQAMGYQLMTNRTLVLEGPICPDQVMNVARDAITAYVECQMMKRIYNEFTALRLSVDWIDIYNFRSFHAADVMQTVKQMAQLIQEKHHNKLHQAKLKGIFQRTVVH